VILVVARLINGAQVILAVTIQQPTSTRRELAAFRFFENPLVTKYVHIYLKDFLQPGRLMSEHP
jgi:hypothetical protein